MTTMTIKTQACAVMRIRMSQGASPRRAVALLAAMDAPVTTTGLPISYGSDGEQGSRSWSPPD